MKRHTLLILLVVLIAVHRIESSCFINAPTTGSSGNVCEYKSVQYKPGSFRIEADCLDCTCNADGTMACCVYVQLDQQQTYAKKQKRYRKWLENGVPRRRQQLFIDARKWYGVHAGVFHIPTGCKIRLHDDGCNGHMVKTDDETQPCDSPFVVG